MMLRTRRWSDQSHAAAISLFVADTFTMPPRHAAMRDIEYQYALAIDFFHAS